MPYFEFTACTCQITKPPRVVVWRLVAVVTVFALGCLGAAAGEDERRAQRSSVGDGRQAADRVERAATDAPQGAHDGAGGAKQAQQRARQYVLRLPYQY